MKFLLLTVTMFIISYFNTLAQQVQPPIERTNQPKATISVFDGIIVSGYVAGGGYLNFTGPNINVKIKNSKFILGMLPSLRFKEDTSKSTKNSVITPNLGAGLTYSYKRIALQVPLYYNTKTVSSNGKWVVGVGVGFVLKK